MPVSNAATALKRLRVKAKMSVREVADALDRPPSTYASYEDKFKKPFLPLDLVHALVPVFEPKGVSRAELMALGGVTDSGPSIAKVPEVPPVTMPDINIQQWNRDVPILGGAACGEDGVFELNGQILDHARRPPRLIGAKDIYALYVHGISMSPWREPGGLVYVHPGQPVKIGDYVVVQMIPDGPEALPAAYIKKLVRRTADKLVLFQWDPRGEKTLPTKKVKSIHRIMDWDELMGI